MSKDNANYDLDARNLRCPLPLLKTKMMLSSMKDREILKVVATDSGSYRDIPAFIKSSVHNLISVIFHEDTHEYEFLIEKKDIDNS
ncbi:sulfurtransferase TusA family protein [Gynuella sp.]|uniref:sulfurtransferase TusA family protein n=1 Tax=Gynuella sp. TaxID=2969146 RepID=UPI003D118F9A